MPRKKKETETIQEQTPVAEAPHGEAEVAEPGVDVQFGRIVVFKMERQLYALPIEVVQEIQQIVEFSPVPGGASALVGMIDLRGEVVPLVDMRVLLGMEYSPYHLDTPLLFARIGGRLMAFAVDEVEDVLDISGMRLQAPSGLYSLAQRLAGVLLFENSLLSVLDPDRLLSTDVIEGVADISKGASK